MILSRSVMPGVPLDETPVPGFAGIALIVRQRSFAKFNLCVVNRKRQDFPAERNDFTDGQFEAIKNGIVER